jgi:hypothetical protein
MSAITSPCCCIGRLHSALPWAAYALAVCRTPADAAPGPAESRIPHWQLWSFAAWLLLETFPCVACAPWAFHPSLHGLKLHVTMQ